MRYYIVDNNGNVYGDFNDEYYAKLILEQIKDDIKNWEELELEIIQGN